MATSRLPSLPGTAPAGSWRITTADLDDGDGRLAIFALVVRDTPTSLRLLGTGFYLVTNGGFATAAHVALRSSKIHVRKSACCWHCAHYSRRALGISPNLAILYSSYGRRSIRRAS